MYRLLGTSSLDHKTFVVDQPFFAEHILDVLTMSIDAVSKSTTYYDILDIAVNANTDEILKAFRKLSLIHHPDKNGGRENEKFTLLCLAKNTLIDPELRRKYDERLSGTFTLLLSALPSM